MKAQWLSALAVPVVAWAAPAPMQLHWLNTTGAEQSRCMDGSPFGYYFRAATNASNSDKWVLELQGGGWCYDEGACYGRTLPSYGGGVFGGSANWTATMGGYFAEHPDWNRVFLRYCSGASFTGFREAGHDASGWPVPGHPGALVPNGTLLWFRGAANIDETLAALQRDHGMGRPRPVAELIVTGSSAGGLATILNVDRIAALAGAEGRTTGLADAGFFKYEANHSVGHYASSANFTADMGHLFAMVNASGALSPACQAAQAAAGATAVPAPGGAERPPAGAFNCMVAATAVRYVASPLFLLQSKFDHFQLGAIAALPCMTAMPYAPPWPNATCSAEEAAQIALYGDDLEAELRGAVAPAAAGAGSAGRRALFLSACIVHGQVSPDAWAQTRVGGVTPQQAWAEWYAGGDGGGGRQQNATTWIEECTLPCNANAQACAPFAPPSNADA